MLKHYWLVVSPWLTEAEWNAGYAQWVSANGYEEEDDDEFDPDLDCLKMKTSSDNVNGCMGEVDKLDLIEIEPDEIPEHIHRLFRNFPRRKEKRTRYDLQAKVDNVQVDGHACLSQMFEFLG